MLRLRGSDGEGPPRDQVSMLPWLRYLVLILSALAACLSGFVDHVIRGL